MNKKRGKGISIKISLTNKWLYTLIAIGILAIVAVGVYAYNSGGPASTVGHSFDEFELCSDNQILKMSGGAWSCESDVDTDTIGSLDCSIVEASLSDYEFVIVTCPSGYRVTGGGYYSDIPALRSWPYAQDRWYCRWSELNTNYKCYAVCCKVA